MRLIWQGKRGQEAAWGREGIAEEPAAPEMLQKATITASQEGIKITRGKVMWHRQDQVTGSSESNGESERGAQVFEI